MARRLSARLRLDDEDLNPTGAVGDATGKGRRAERPWRRARRHRWNCRADRQVRSVARRDGPLTSKSSDRAMLPGPAIAGQAITRAKSDVFEIAGLLSMPMRGGAIQPANARSRTCFIRLPIKSPSSFDGPLLLSRFQVASSISLPAGVALTSLNSPIWRWKPTCGSRSQTRRRLGDGLVPAIEPRWQSAV